MADDDELEVKISGPALALLLYENTRTVEQFGFLLGEVLIYVTTKVTDLDRDIEHTKHNINIKNIVAYPLGDLFFNSGGKIDKEKLLRFLNQNVEKVVGWYHYRDEVPLMPLWRDRQLHDELSKFFTASNKYLTRENFIFGILNSTISDVGGTHKFKQIWLRKKNLELSPISMKINNLGADSSKSDVPDYKPEPKYSSCNEDTFDLVYKHIKNDLSRTKSDVSSVMLIQKTAEHLLEKIIPELTKSDENISELEKKVEELRHKKYQYLFEKTLLEQQMRNMEVESNKSEAETEPKTPEIQRHDSPDIFESPKSVFSNIKQAATRNLKMDDNNDAKNKCESLSSERDLLLLNYDSNSHKSASTYFTNSDGSRYMDSPSSPDDIASCSTRNNDFELQKNVRMMREINNDQFTQPGTAAASTKTSSLINNYPFHSSDRDSGS